MNPIHKNTFHSLFFHFALFIMKWAFSSLRNTHRALLESHLTQLFFPVHGHYFGWHFLPKFRISFSNKFARHFIKRQECIIYKPNQPLKNHRVSKMITAITNHCDFLSLTFHSFYSGLLALHKNIPLIQFFSCLFPFWQHFLSFAFIPFLPPFFFSHITF